MSNRRRLPVNRAWRSAATASCSRPPDGMASESSSNQLPFLILLPDRHATRSSCRLRLYSAKTLAPLAVLSLHRLSLQAIAFAPILPQRTRPPAAAARGAFADPEADSDDSDDEDGGGGASTSNRRLWLATGGQEAKISLWEPYPARPS